MRRILGLLVLVSLGCGGSDNPGNNGNGADGGTPATAIPPCLRSLDCQPTVTCTTQPLDPSNPYLVNTCYASGVKSCMTMDMATGGALVTTTYKADGVSLCYKMTMLFSAAGMVTTYTDPAGTQFATATSTSTTSTIMNVTCASDGQTYPLDIIAVGAGGCVTGTCACPQ